MKRRIISALLLIVMLISLVPAQAFAEETMADISSTEMTVGGDSSFGGLLGNTVSEEQKKQSGSGEFECRITELTVEGTTAVVEYSVNTPATVVVAIYSDDGFTMLGSGTASAAVDNTWVAVDIEISKMPKFFTAGAFMLDPETNNPLSEEYKTTRYTKAYMDIKAATVADFDPELVLNLDDSMTTNFAVFNENTILFDYTSDAVLTDYHNGTYLIESAGKDLLAMQPGDKFAYTYADGTVLIVCAAYVEVNGTSVSVTEQMDADLSDVFDFVKIEADSFDKEVTYDDSVLPEGVEMIDTAEADRIYEASLMGLGDRPLKETKESKSISKATSINYKFDSGVKLTGSVNFACTVTLEVFISLNYRNISLSLDKEASISIEISGKAGIGRDGKGIPLMEMGVELLPGVSVGIQPYFVFEVSGSIKWTGKVKSTTKFVYDSDIGFTDQSSGPSLKNEVSVSGKLFVGIEATVGLSVKIKSVISKREFVKIVEGGVKFKVGCEVSMKNKIDDLSTPDTGRVHECVQCYEGDLNKVVSLSVYLDILDGKIKPELVLAEAKSKISDCYCSIDFQEFGLTRCPHISHKVSVQLLKGENPVQTCVPIELYEGTRQIDKVYILGSDLKPAVSAVPTTGDDGTSTFYLPNGKYKVIVELDGERQEKEFTVRNGEKQLKLVFEEKGSDYPLTISQTTVKMDKGSTQQLNAYFNGKDVTRSCTWQSSDSTAASVSKGKVTAKKAGSAAISASYSSGGKTYSVSCTVTIAGAEIASGKCGENLTWTLDDAGTLMISGTGEMTEHSTAFYPWSNHGNKIKSVVIESGVTSISYGAFYSCKAITNVMIPNSVTSVSRSVFGECYSLTRVDVSPENKCYSSIDGVLFNKAGTELVYYPEGRKGSYNIPNGVINIGSSAFSCCFSITNVTIPDSVASIGANAFGYCSTLTSVTIGSGVSSIGWLAFTHCTALTSINVASGNSYYASVNGVLFNKSLTELVCFPAGRKGSYKIPDSVTSISDDAFSWCDLASVTIPDSVINIGSSAFSWCDFASVTIPDSVTSIGEKAFFGCTALTSVTIGNGVTSIGVNTFVCLALKSVTIGNSVTNIGEAAFLCSNLTDVYYVGTEAQWNAITIASGNGSLTSATIHFAATDIASGKCGDNLTWTLDENGTLTISGTGEMYNYEYDSTAPWSNHSDEIKSVVIESGVTSIGSSAFSNCTALTSVTIPDSVTTIGSYAFSGCTALTSVTIPDRVTSIGSTAFWCCISLTSINVASGNEYYASIDGVLFNKAVTELLCFPGGRTGAYTIPNSVTSIGNYAFYCCTSLTSVTIGSGVTSIGANAFNTCTSLTSVTIGSGVTSIGESAFYGCIALTSITTTNSVTSIGCYAFSYCYSLTSVTIPDSVTNIGEQAFSYCDTLTSVTIGSGVTSIGEWAFSGCKSLTSVTIPNSVTSIGWNAFAGCTALKDVYYTGSEAEWDAISIGTGNDPLINAVIHYGEIDADKMSILLDAEPEEPKEDAAEPEEPTEEEEEPLPEIEIEPETETEPETEEEESPDALIVDVPDAAPAAELELAAAHTGTSGTNGKFRTAKFTNLEPGEEYVLIVSVDPAALLKPANLLYIAQDNAAADGTLTLSYIPRTETPSAAVTLYGVPHERYITLDREYMAMQVGESAVLSAEVTPAKWAEYLTWSAENPTGREIISVSGSGSVTALGVGTAYAVATVSYKDYTFTARCRVDVTEKSVEEEIEISGIELGTTAVTSELYSRDYAEADILLLLPQNMSVMSADAAEKPEDNGIAIKSARFMDPAAAEKFDLAVVDDRRVAVVPKDSSIENAKAVKSSYTSAVAVTVGNTEFVTDAKLRLTVKKTLPKLKADAVQFNSFYSGQSAPIVINGASVTAIRPDTGKKLAVPAWLTLSDDGKLSIAPDAPGKSASGSAYVLVDTEEWAIPAAVTVSVKNTYKAPKLKLSAASVTMSSVSSKGVEMKLMPTAKNETLEQYNVTGLTAYDGYTVENFDAETGAFTLKATEGSTAGKITLYVSFADTETTVPIALTVKKTAPVIKLKTSSVTLNPAYGDMAIIDVTITPADYDDRTVSVSNAESELEVWYKDGKLYVHSLPNTKYSSTYKLSISAGDGKAAVLTVRTAKGNLKPSVTLRASGAIDLTYSDSAVTLTPAFRNFNGGYSVTGGTVTETKGKTEISSGDISSYFSMEQNGNTLTLKKAEGTELTAGNTYMAKLTMLLGGEKLTAAAKITVKATPVNLRLSKSALTLNKLVNDSAAIGVTCTTKNYTLGEPVISVMDKTGRQSAEGKLNVSYSGGMLYVAVNDATEYGAVYKVLISAGEGYKAAVLNVTVPAQAKSAITGTLKAKGSIDIIRSGSGITLVPTYKNVSSAEYTERVEVYSSADKFAKPVEGVFAIDGMKLTNICADSRLKYKVRVIAGFANGAEAATPLTAITVKTGAARLTVSGTPVLYLKDVNSRGDFRITSADLTLNGIARAEIKDAKNAAMFELYEYGGGRFAIGFRDGVIAPATAKLKSVSIPINIWLDGSETAKPDAAVTIRINIAK